MNETDRIEVEFEEESEDEDVMVMEAIKAGINAYHNYLERTGLDSSYFMPEMKVKFMDVSFEEVLRSLEYKELA